MDLNTLFSVKGKVAVVTGGSRGIGLMIARGLAVNGAKVYISSRKADVCDKVAQDLNSLRAGSAISIPADLSKDSDCEKLFAFVSKREKRVDILVNNAGANWGAPLESYPMSAWDKVLNLNVKAVFRLTQLFTPLLEGKDPADCGRVINIGSINGFNNPNLETYAYSASKAAVHQLTRVMAGHLGPRNITVNAVAPGPFESHMMKDTLNKFGDMITAGVPLGRIGLPTDMAGICLFLASPAGAYVNGAVIPVDGGILVRPAL